MKRFDLGILMFLGGGLAGLAFVTLAVVTFQLSDRTRPGPLQPFFETYLWPFFFGTGNAAIYIWFAIMAVAAIGFLLMYAWDNESR